MKYEAKLPQLTETMEYATVLQFYKNIGDFVEKGEPLYEVETDKVTMQMESLDTGYLCEIKVELNREIPPGTVVAVLADTKGER